jgi:hypothetical protein
LAIGREKPSKLFSMKPSLLCSALATLLAAAGCGDNSKVCGPGTDDLDGDGYCEAGGGGGVPCGDGTILDPQTHTCVVDPSSCQGGTVLIHDRCVDPTEGLDVDLSEGPEPNNAGIVGVEASGAVAGQIALKPAGQTFVVKGTINPFRDADGNGELDPDMDAYTFSVGAPTLLEISVDGVGGMMGAFVVVPVGGSPAAGWRRFGLNVTGDTSKRQIFLPAAGTYAISVADTRSLFLDAGGPPAAGQGAAAGGPDASYFMSITALAMPAPTALTVTGGTATSTGSLAPDEVKLFTAPMGAGLNEIELAIPTTPRAAVVALRSDVYVADAVEPLAPAGPARVTAGGFAAGDLALIVADTVYHYGPGGAAYTLTVRPATAVALPRTGGTASQPEVPGRMAAFYYDVAAADEVTGFALTWNQPVGGMIVDARGAPVASFTYDPTARAFTDHTFTSYTGLVRHRAAGRYYFLAFDPAGAGPAELAATSTIAAQPCPTIVKGTPLAGQAVSGTFQSNAFLYDAGTTDRWQLFNATGTGTGVIVNAFFDRATAYGRLDPISSTGTGELVPDATPIFWQSFPEAGGAQGRILLDDPATSFLVTTRAQITTGAPTFTLDFRARAYHDFGAIAAGQTITLQNEALGAATPARLYLLRAGPGDKLSITATPRTGTLDTRLQLLTRDEAVDRTFDPGGAGAPDVAQVLQAGSGWTALAVAAASPAGAFDLTIGATAYVKPTYARAPGRTVYENACLGGTTQPLVSDGSPGAASNEGFTAAPISTPPGFAFYGLLEPRLTASTNGWLSFGPVSRAQPANADLPASAGPNALIAPYWDDLTNVTICTKTVGTRLVVQWTGKVAGPGAATVETQAILDGATGSIELVWGPNHAPNGAEATVGIEDQVGLAASKIGYNTAGAAAAGTTVVLTPM